MAALGWANLGLNAVSAISNFIGGNKNIDKQIKAQKDENEKNRQYNKMLAEQQNKWNVEQWERENYYNTPSNQIKRMKDAGLNPDLVYGNGAAQSLSATSPNLTSGAASSPVDVSALGQKMTMGQAIQQSLNNAMMRAQIDNVKADTANKSVNTDLLNIDKETREMANQLGLDILAIEKNLKGQQAENAFEQFNILKKQYEKTEKEIQSLDIDIAIKNIEKSFKTEQMQAIVDKLKADANISEQDAELAIQGFTYKLMGIEAEGRQAEESNKFLKLLNESDEGSLLGTLLKGINYVLQSLK